MSSQTSEMGDIQGTGIATKICIGVGAAVLIGGSIMGILALVNVIGDVLDNSSVVEAPNDKGSVASTTKPSDQKTDDGENSNTENIEQPESSDNSSSSNNSSNTNNSGNTSPAPVGNGSTNLVAPQIATSPATSPNSSLIAGQNQSATGGADLASARPDQMESPLRSDWQGIIAVIPSTPSQPTTPTTPAEPSEPEKQPDYNLNEDYAYVTCGGRIDDAFDVSAWAIAKSDEDAQTACNNKVFAEVRTHEGYADLSDEEIIAKMSDQIGSAGPLSESLCEKSGLSCGRW